MTISKKKKPLTSLKKRCDQRGIVHYFCSRLVIGLGLGLGLGLGFGLGLGLSGVIYIKSVKGSIVSRLLLFFTGELKRNILLQ